MEPKKEDIDFILTWLKRFKKVIPAYFSQYKLDIKKASYLFRLIDKAVEIYKSLPEKPRRWKEYR
mgnify:CR=1 FL=1